MPQGKRHADLPKGVEIAHADQVVDMCDNPATAFKEKKNSSLTIGLNLLRDGAGDAFVSAGSTGALLSGATLVTKRIKGIRRAAMAPVVPTGTGGAVLIDCGATAEGTPEYLLQFAFMGSYYAERVLLRPEPKVALLNIGAEPSKGTDLQREAYPPEGGGEAGRILFVGNVEARERSTAR
jgi:glycerol-3-phosphate acyltransferase PlsX